MSIRYETVFIMTPVLSEAQTKETVTKFKKVLKDHKAKVLHEEKWGLRELAYPIKKKSTGFYHLLEFEAEGDVANQLEVQFKRDERIIRFLTTRMDKHAIAYAEKRRSKGSDNKKQGAATDQEKASEEKVTS